VHDLPDEAVVRWGDKIGSHGADVVSVNTKTGDVTLWDAKYRSNEVRIQPSPTFKRDASRANAIKEAKKSIANNKTLPEDIKRKALDNLEEGKVKTRTVGMGNAKNSRTE
jgi:filamentous hemagglutinin